ncbi:MAG: uracil-DNA glycosylase family protein [Bacteroidales bacterium]|jgi:G:T/U-mismatch repair DNA glycosylase|nr:uracil-DNA glycosylase family protein [Bacteroidales bacterium]
MKTDNMEKHPLPPFFPKGSKILMLGSFPPAKIRWKMNFFYPNFQNDMWRIFGLAFYNDKNHFLTENLTEFNETLLRSFLAERGIALWDTAMEIIREQGNASDKFLKVLRPIDIDAVLKELPACKAIVATGQKALEILSDLLNLDTLPVMGEYSEISYNNRQLRIYRMPSSSRAYPKSLTEKAEIYKKMFIYENLLLKMSPNS